VPPFPTEQAIAILESAYGKPIDTVFTRFDREPLAAASIAQVHAAELPDGTEVVVKVLRPGVREKIEQDLEVMRTIAALASRYWEHGERLKPLEVVAEYEQTIIDELDLMREAGNAAQLKRNFEGSEMLYVPEIYWDFCRPEVLVQERIHGIPISDMEALRAAGTNIEKLAENGVEIFFTQVFRHNFFHADMHPGNIFVTLNPEDKQYLAENFLAFFERDYYRIAKLHLDSGWVPDDARIDQLETAVRTVCEPIFNKPLSEISFAQVLMRLFRKQWMDEQVGARAMIDDLRENLPQLRQALRELPGVIRELSERATAGDLTLDLRSAEIERIRRELEGQRQQRYWLIVAMTSLLAGTLVLTLQGNLYIGGGLLVAGALGVFAGRPNA
jgi:ubiquinone biosynthesis protein